MNSKSFTIFEIIIVMLVMGIVAALAAPKAVELVNEARAKDELNTVGNVKSGIAIAYLGNVTKGISPAYPHNLDNASLAKASSTNPLFDTVLQHGITKGWEKLEQYRYRGPTGQKYEFNPDTGTFEPVEVIPPPPPVPSYLSSTFGGTGYEYLNSILLTPDGGYILAGYTQGSPGLGVGAGDFYVVKVDAYGNKVWEQTYGGWSQEVPGLIQNTSDGGYIMVGWTASYGVGRDAYIVKMDSSGNMEWQKNLGGAGTDEGLGIQQTSDGGYIMSGYATSPETGIQDAYLVKLNSSGDTEWENMYGGVAPDFFDSIQQTSDNGYLVAGATSSYLNDTSDAYLIKINSSGTIEWQNTFGSAKYDGIYDIQKTSDGGYVMAGSTSSSGVGVSTMYLVKTDSLGSIQWEKSYGDGFSGAWEGASGVQQTSDGGYIMIGTTQSGYGNGGADVHLVKVDSSGTTQWQKMYGGTDGDNGLSVQVINDDGGNTIGYAIGASTQSFGAGSMDYWLIKTDANGNIQ